MGPRAVCRETTAWPSRDSSNARFPLGPSALAFALNKGGSILNTTGPALRDLAGR